MLCMAIGTASGHRIILMGLGQFNHIMAGRAKFVLPDLKKTRLICHMGVVAGLAAIPHGGMDRVPGEALRIVAFKAELFSRSVEEVRLFGVVRLMAGDTVSVLNGSVHRVLGAGFPHGGMAGQADDRNRLAHQNRRDQSMGEMTGFAVVLRDRGMNISDLIAGRHVRMALGARLSTLRLDLLGAATRQKDQNPQADKTESQGLH